MHQNNHYLAAGVAAKLWLVCWPQCTQCAVVISGHKISYQMRRCSTPFQNHKSNQPAFSLLHLLGTINQDNDVVAKHFNMRDLLLKQACRQHISWFNSSGCVYFFFFYVEVIEADSLASLHLHIWARLRAVEQSTVMHLQFSLNCAVCSSWCTDRPPRSAPCINFIHFQSIFQRNPPPEYFVK